jgi:spore germination protein GerM
MAARKRNTKGSGSNAGTVFWLAAIVIVLFLFALNWGKIQETLKNTHFHEIIQTQTGVDKAPDQPLAQPDKTIPAQDKAPPSKDAARPKNDKATDAASKAGDKSPLPDKAASKDSGSKAAADKPEPEDSGDAERPIASKPKQPKSPADAQGGKTPAAATRSRSASLYFVRIDDDGTIVRQETKRQVPASDSPLLDAMGALLKGPSEEELRRNLISLVPSGTKLLSAKVQGSTAYLNFNEAFMYNHYGIEGYAGQLKQIVYTATAFPTVQDVQILIEGTKRDYLGGEGVFIGRPLSRNSF